MFTWLPFSAAHTRLGEFGTANLKVLTLDRFSGLGHIDPILARSSTLRAALQASNGGASCMEYEFECKSLLERRQAPEDPFDTLSGQLRRPN